jgi:GH25 family lysozyme M1 (1,4-beta-N-acetylmuramidase)
MTQQVHSAQGEDRSSFQEVQPWAADSFGFAKATEGTGWTDPTFKANWTALRDAGKPRGAYHFFHPEEDPAKQADFFLSVVRENGMKAHDMLVVDSELMAGADGILQSGLPNGIIRASVPISGIVLPSSDLVGSGTLKFLQTVAQLLGDHRDRHPLIVYTSLSVGAQLGSCTDFDLWIAYWSDNAPASVAPWSSWRFWQWGSGGGPGGGDRDAYNGTEADLNTWLSSFAS